MSQDTSNMTQDTPGGERPEVQQTSASVPVPPKKKAAARKKTAASASVTDTTAASDSDAVVVPQPRRRNGRVTFYTSRTSMFLDGYDLERERIEVLPLIQAAEEGQPIEAANPLFDRYMLYLDRAAEHERNSKVRQQRAQESGAVTRSEVKAYRALGGFSNADDEGDSVVIHTREAFQLFIGRAADPDNSKAARIISFKKVGAAYRLLWNLSSNNNPYADWALVGLSDQRDQLQLELSKSVQDLEHTLSELQQRRGMKFSVARNNEPQSLPIRFKSPYAYALVETLAEFDYLVRLVRTLVFKARLTPPLADQLIRDHMRLFRGHFNEVKKFEKFLGEPDLLLLTRNDFLPTADDVARKRVSKCIDLFGEVPRSIFRMEQVPPFKAQRTDLSEAEKAMLQKVSTGVSDEMDHADALAQERNAQGLV